MNTDPFNEGLVCEDEVPLEWSSVDALPSEQQMGARHVSNDALIHACEALEEAHRPPDDGSEVAHELIRIESKLNLVLELLGEWLRTQSDVPPVRRIRFNASGIEWQGPDGPPAGTLVRIRFHPCRVFPRALELFGEVVRSTPDEGGLRTVVKLLGMSQGVADGIERLVFRRHRREVAQIRGRQK